MYAPHCIMPFMPEYKILIYYIIHLTVCLCPTVVVIPSYDFVNILLQQGLPEDQICGRILTPEIAVQLLTSGVPRLISYAPEWIPQALKALSICYQAINPCRLVLRSILAGDILEVASSSLLATPRISRNHLSCCHSISTVGADLIETILKGTRDALFWGGGRSKISNLDLVKDEHPWTSKGCTFRIFLNDNRGDRMITGGD